MEQKIIIGREGEASILSKLLKSPDPELLAIYGRRRVGKTFLIRNFYHSNMVFSVSGQHNGKTSEQLLNFTEELNTWFPQKKQLSAAVSWPEAFNRLKEATDSIKHKNKKVFFFDELPWLDNHKSGFLSSFSHFWNTYASTRNDILVIICGSAASWIIEKVINNKGGLHNRVTQKIRLLPFTLKETQAYLQHRQINIEPYQLLQLYMVMGGIPAYLNGIEKGKSAAQNIERICFSKDGILASEFNNLYASLFNTPEKHIQVIQALAKKNKGLARLELLKAAKLSTGGGTTTVLNELTESGFIEKVFPFEKTERNILYHLTDEFSLFYFKFMHNQKGNEKGQWLAKQASPSYVSWCGYAFENICLKHVTQIKMALQIGGLQTAAVSWLKSGTGSEKGAQIDLLIDRADHSINICEMKFSTQAFAIDKKYAGELRNKIMAFRQDTKTRKQLILTFITTYGLQDNVYREQLAEQELTMEALFL
jgi:AAA+ ATPase superfamily predicted ATPase